MSDTTKRVSQLSQAEQLRRFVSALFREEDLIEIRPIETWTDPKDGRRRSCLFRNHRYWIGPREISSVQEDLDKLNRCAHANVFFGVNPRPSPGAGAKRDIQICRSVWADLDYVTIDQAVVRWQSISLPPPSITVISGHGVHAYWLLEQEFTVHGRPDRVAFESMLQAFYRELGSDAISDLSRLLRLPGFLNTKEARVGRRPIPCTLVDCCPNRTYPLDVFTQWTADRSPSQHTDSRSPCDGSRQPHGPDFHFPSTSEVRYIVDTLDAPATDRSRRDYRVVCELLRRGVPTEEIWRLVGGKSKFRTNGRAYFDTTISNAARDVVQ